LVLYPDKYQATKDDSIDWWKHFRDFCGYNASMKAFSSTTHTAKMKVFIEQIMSLQVSDHKKMKDFYRDLDYVAIKACFLADPILMYQKGSYPSIPLVYRSNQRIMRSLHILFDWIVLVCAQFKFYTDDLSSSFSLPINSSSSEVTQAIVYQCHGYDLIEIVSLQERIEIISKSLPVLEAKVYLGEETSTATGTSDATFDFLSLPRILLKDHSSQEDDMETASLLKILIDFNTKYAPNYLVKLRVSDEPLGPQPPDAFNLDAAATTIIIQAMALLKEGSLSQSAPDPSLVMQLLHRGCWNAARMLLLLIDSYIRYHQQTLSSILAAHPAIMPSYRDQFISAMSCIVHGIPSAALVRSWLSSNSSIADFHSSSNSSADLCELSPIHVAMFARRADFIIVLLKIFPSSSIDADIVRYAVSEGYQDTIFAILASHPLHTWNTVSLNARFLKQAPCDLSAHMRYQPGSRSTLQILAGYFDSLSTSAAPDILAARLLRVISHHDMLEHAQEEQPSSFAVKDGILSGLILRRGHEGCYEVAMMDGSFLLIEIFITDVCFLRRALCAPRHQSFRQNLINLLSLSIDHPSRDPWVLEKISFANAFAPASLIVDSVVSTPLVNSIRAGNLTLAHALLSDLMAYTISCEESGSLHLDSSKNRFRSILKHCNSQALSEDGSSYHPDLAAIYLQPTRMEYEAACESYIKPYDQVDDAFMRSRCCCSQQVRPPSTSSSACAINSLHAVFAYISNIWKYLTSLSPEANDFLAYSTTSSLNGIPTSSIDSITRARKILVLLGIPLSRLGSSSTMSSGNNRVKVDYASLSPDALDEVMSLLTRKQLRALLIDWYRLRLNLAVIHRSQTNQKTTEASSEHFYAEWLLLHDLHISLVTFAEFHPAGEGRALQPYSLYELLDIETQAPYRNPGATSTAKPSTRRDLIEGARLANALHYAYIILEFARFLLVGQAIKVSTMEYVLVGDSSTPKQHLWYQQRKYWLRCRDAYDRFKSELEPNEGSEKSKEQIGANHRIRLCKDLGIDEMQTFLTIYPSLSARYHRIQQLIIHALIRLLSATNHITESDFLHKYADEEQASRKGLSQESFQSGLTKLLHVLDHNIRIRDLYNCREELIAHLSACTTDLHSMCDSSSIVPKLFCSDGELIEIQNLVNRGSSSASASQLKSDLSSAYRVADVLYAYLRSIAGVMRSIDIYDQDVQLLVDKHYQQNNLLTTILREHASPNSSTALDAHHRLLVQDIGKKLLQLGIHPIKKDPLGHTPLILAALKGYDGLVHDMVMAIDLHPPAATSVADACIKKNKWLKHLIWNILFIAPMIDLHRAAVQQGYEECLLLLIEFGFPSTKPATAMLTCIDLAILKNMRRVSDRLIALLTTQEARKALLSANEAAIVNSLLMAILATGESISLVCLRTYHQHLQQAWREKSRSQQLIAHAIDLQGYLATAINHDLQQHRVYLQANTEGSVEDDAIASTMITSFFYRMRRSCQSDRLAIVSDENDRQQQHSIMNPIRCILNDLSQSRTSASITMQVSCIIAIACIATKVSDNDNDNITAMMLADFVYKEKDSLAWLHWIVIYDRIDMLAKLIDKHHAKIEDHLELWLTSRSCAALNSGVQTSLLHLAIACRSRRIINYLLSGLLDEQSSALHKLMSSSHEDTSRRLERCPFPPAKVISASSIADHQVIQYIVHGQLTGIGAAMMLHHTVEGSSLLLEPMTSSPVRETLLHIACRRADVRLIEYLLDCHADPLQRDDQGYAPLHCAVSCGHAAVSKLLRQHPKLKQLTLAIKKFEYLVRRYLLNRYSSQCGSLTGFEGWLVPRAIDANLLPQY
jgi:ankyrin repeat protein